MWKSKLFCMFFGLWAIFGSASSWADFQKDDDFSNRITVQDSLDHCISTIYQIRSGELTQEEGLNQLEATLEMVKFMAWYWIED